MNRGRKNYRFTQKTIENLQAMVELYEGKCTETDIVERAIQKMWEEKHLPHFFYKIVFIYKKL